MQAETWTTRAGAKIKLEEMTDDHRRYVLAYVVRRAAIYKTRYDAALLRSVLTPKLVPDVIANYNDMDIEVMRAPVIHDDVEWMIDQQLNTPAAEWIETTPLVRRLRVLVGEDLVQLGRKTESAPAPHFTPQVATVREFGQERGSDHA